MVENVVQPVNNNRDVSSTTSCRLVVESWTKAAGAASWQHVLGGSFIQVLATIASEGPNGEPWLFLISSYEEGLSTGLGLHLFDQAGHVQTVAVRDTDPQEGAYDNCIIAGGRLFFPWKDPETGEISVRCFSA